MHAFKQIVFPIFTESLQTVYQVKYMYIKQFNECFGCTKSVLFPLNVPAPPLSMAEFREYNHVQLLKITPFIHWEMGFSRL